MKKSFFIIVIALSSALIPAQECPPAKPNQQDLIILPDTAGEEALALFGHHAVNNFQTNQLEKLLRAQAAPILVEKTIWKRFVRKKKGALQQFQAIPFSYYEVANFILALPTKHRQDAFRLSKLKAVKKPFEMTPGLLDPVKGYAKTLLTLVNVYTSLVKALQACMQAKGYNWNIVLFGHGGPGLGAHTARVAGIPFTEFKKLLSFMEQKISTNIFLYQTCYAGSRWLLKSYESNNKSDTYSFPIILTGISEAPVYSSTGTSLTVYQSFFQQIKQISLCKEHIQKIGVIAGVLLEAIAFDRNKNKLILKRVNNILQIRWAGSTQFVSIPVDRLISTAQTAPSAQSDQPIRITTSAFIIDSPQLVRPIILTKNNHSLLSSLPIKTHSLAKIIMEKSDQKIPFMQQLFSFFTPMRKLTSSKLFLIDTVSNNVSNEQVNNVMIFLNSSTPTTLPLQKRTELFYRIGNIGYRFKQDAKNAEKLPENTTQKYLKLFTKEKKALTN